MVEEGLKFKAPLKLRSICGSPNKALSWEELQGHSRSGPGCCVSCKKALESIDHLLTRCIDACEVWSEIETLPGNFY